MRKILLILILFITSSTLLLAGTTGKLTGKVIDAKTKEALPFVNVVILGTNLGAATDIDGNYTILNIPPGKYDVKVQYIGYQAVIVEGISISIDLTTRQDFTLSESSVELEAVVVEGRKDVLKKDVTSSQSSVSADQISALPVQEFSDLLQLQPGVSKDADGGFHIRGGRTSEIAYWVNGISITDPYDNSRGIDIDNSSVQELQVISGTFNAEYGNAMSGIVNTVTKEGGRKYHGSLNIYSSDYVSNFTSYFANIDNYDPFTNYNFQGSLSGPVPFTNDKITFFGNARYNYDDGYLYGYNFYNPDGSKGNGKPVSMSWSKKWQGLANIAYQIIPGVKINTEFLYSTDKYQDYDHSFKWEPGGNPIKYSRSYNGTISINHVLSPKAFYTLRGNYFFKDFKQRLYYSTSDPRYLHPDSLNTVNYAFHTKGTDLHRFFRETNSYSLKFDFSGQFTDNHLVQFGAEAKRHDILFDDYTLQPLTVNGIPVDPFRPAIPDLSSTNRNNYNAKPIEFSAYLQDKIEYKSVIINIGLRWDYFDSKGKAIVDPADPNINIPLRAGMDSLTIAEREPYYYKNATAKSQLSPRFGIAYPLSVDGVVHFSYGWFLQIPNFQYLFNGGEYKVPETGNVNDPFGNPDIKPQKTIMYEIGFRQQFSSDYVADVTAFYRDIRDWITAGPPTPTLNGVTYSVYTNKDYSNVRGITLSFSKRFTNHFSFDLNYTYQVAEGSNSNPDDEFRAAQGNQEPAVFLSPLNWDQRHNLNFNFMVGDKDWGVSLLARYGTGLPYTPSVTQYTSDRGLSTGFESNSRRRPMQFVVDLKANKTFSIAGLNLTTYVKVFNLFDARTVVNVFGDTGEPNFTTEAQNVGIDPNRPNTVAEYLRYPDHYGAPRLVQTGIEISF